MLRVKYRKQHAFVNIMLRDKFFQLLFIQVKWSQIYVYFLVIANIKGIIIGKYIYKKLC